MKKMAPILALAPVFAVGAGAAWHYHLPVLTAVIVVAYIGFLLAYARARDAQ